MKKNSDYPAFPHLTYNETTGAKNGFLEGLTKREYFAAMAMQGILANPEIFKIYPNSNPGTIMNLVSISAIEHADDILSELDNPVK